MLNKKFESSIPQSERFFINRSLNMFDIKLIGFDMDHTIISYYRERFEKLAFKHTLNKLLDRGYPQELCMLKFDPDFVTRGLLVDRERGNILKADSHKYIKIAYHGRKLLDKEERSKLYNNLSFKAEKFLSLDTFFALSEVQLFVEIVDFLNKNPGKIQKSFDEIYQDIRVSIDLSHQDGSIKNEVLANPEFYVELDDFLVPTLVSLLESGKSLFLLTNSAFDYTDSLMSFLMSNSSFVDIKNWREIWDVIIVDSKKPLFFESENSFYTLDAQNNEKKVTEGNFFPDEIYMKGNAKSFEQLTGYKGDEILYVGDHIFGDIMKSKNSVNWRTLFLIPELKSELFYQDSNQKITYTLSQKLKEKEFIDEEYQVIKTKILNKNILKYSSKLDLNSLEKKLSGLSTKLVDLKKEIKYLINQKESIVHPVWGSLMKTGLEHSRFARQVIQHACMYTSKASNFRHYSSMKRFVSFHDHMPHDFK